MQSNFQLVTFYDTTAGIGVNFRTHTNGWTNKGDGQIRQTDMDL